MIETIHSYNKLPGASGDHKLDHHKFSLTENDLKASELETKKLLRQIIHLKEVEKSMRRISRYALYRLMYEGLQFLTTIRKIS